MVVGVGQLEADSQNVEVPDVYGVTVWLEQLEDVMTRTAGVGVVSHSSQGSVVVTMTGRLP